MWITFCMCAHAPSETSSFIYTVGELQCDLVHILYNFTIIHIHIKEEIWMNMSHFSLSFHPERYTRD